jgi:hypothetical protein
VESLVVESAVSLTVTVADVTALLPVSSLTVPQTLNVAGAGAGALTARCALPVTF